MDMCILHLSIIRIKREQEEKKQEPTYTIKLTDKAVLEEFDLKSAIFQSTHKNKSANRNPANYRLYHALMEALIADENVMDKEVTDTVKDHKRKHNGDDDDDNDDKGPPAGSNQGKSTKKRRRRESESAKKPSTTKESSKSKDPKVGSKTGHVSDPEDTDNNMANSFSKAHQDPDENKLHKKIDDIGSFIRWYCRRIGKEELSKADPEGPTFMMIDLVNPEGHQIVPDISNPLALGGPLRDKEQNRALSISKLKSALYQDFGLEELVMSLWIESEQEYDINAAYGITHWWFNRKQFYINKHSEPSDRDA
ncbi:hypothetical protein Tco_1268278, partial [Tanacetum coccineum]